MATHDVAGRMLASLGQGGPVDSRFEPCVDVPKAGALLALPALLASGLWKHTEEHFQLPPGYYQLVHLFLLVAFKALARVKSLESLRYCAPGEWGKVLGLDRIPEGRTLREELLLAERVTVLSNGFAVREIRHLEGSGHQTAVLATTWRLSEGAVAAGMFGGWSQENFLKVHAGTLCAGPLGELPSGPNG